LALLFVTRFVVRQCAGPDGTILFEGRKMNFKMKTVALAALTTLAAGAALAQSEVSF